MSTAPNTKTYSRANLEMLISKDVTKGDPVFIRIFRAERELELWMRKVKRFTLLKTQCH